MFRYYYLEYADKIGLQIHDTNRLAHDLYLGILADSGIFGLFSFLSIVFLTLWHLEKTRKRWLVDEPHLANLAAGFFIAIVSYLATGIFLSFAYERYFWVMLALAGALCCISETSQSLPRKSFLDAPTIKT
jgi:O-antigen ligase